MALQIVHERHVVRGNAVQRDGQVEFAVKFHGNRLQMAGEDPVDVTVLKVVRVQYERAARDRG